MEALIAGIQDGTIDCLSTDHAPHTPADKAAGMAGISNIEHAFQIYLKVFQKTGFRSPASPRCSPSTPQSASG